MSGDGSTFAAFFERQHADLSRLAYLLSGDATAADDLAADALCQVRRDWPRVADEDPAAYARGLVATATRDRERRGLFGAIRRGSLPRPEVAGRPGTEVCGALRRLPHRRRVCVVLRYGFGLSEDEVVRALGISAGAARSRTSRGVRQLSELLDGTPGAARLGEPTAPRPPSGRSRHPPRPGRRPRRHRPRRLPRRPRPP